MLYFPRVWLGDDLDKFPLPCGLYSPKPCNNDGRSYVSIKTRSGPLTMTIIVKNSTDSASRNAKARKPLNPKALRP